MWLCWQALQGEEQTEELGSRLPKRSKRAWEAGTEEEEEAARKEKEDEEARERDQREKEEFAERLRLKDEEKTKKIMEAKVSKEQLEVRGIDPTCTWHLGGGLWLRS